MSERFDPYQAWLGVPRSSQPSYYQLLGLQNFESEPPVIAEAAEQAIAKVAAHRSGPDREAAERVLGKLKSAKDVLLSAEKRQAYDQQLRAHLGPVAPPSLHSAPVSAADSPTMMLPPGSLPPLAAGGGFPPTAPAGYPPGSAAPGYGAQYSQGPAYPQQAPGYAQQAPGYAQQAPGYPPQAAGYPQQGPGYPQQGPGYPPMAGMPPQAGYAPQGGYAGQQPFGSQPQAGDQFAGNQAPQGSGMPGSFVPFAGLSHAIGDLPPQAPAAAPPFAAPQSFSAPPQAATHMPGLPSAAAKAPMAPARSADPGFAHNQTAPAIRRGTQRRQQNSTVMVALGVLCGAVALLVVAIIAANKNDDQAQNNAAPVAPASQAASTTPPPAPGLGISFLTTDPVRVDPSFSGASSGPRPELPGMDVPSSVNVAQETSPEMRNQQAANNIVGMLIPEGYKPSPATPTPTGMMPVAVPLASATGTAAMPAPATPSGTAPSAAVAMPTGPAPKPTPISIAGTSTGAPAMEASLPPDAARAKTVQTMTKSVKASLKTRDYARAEDVALQSLVLADAPDVVAMTFEQHRAVELVRALWNGVRDGIRSLKPGDEIFVNSKAAKVVRQDENTLVVNQDNKDITLLIAKLAPASLAVQLAERALPADDSTTKLSAGIFLVLDAVGDKEKGRALIAEAGAAGAEVEKLLAWLDMPE